MCLAWARTIDTLQNTNRVTLRVISDGQQGAYEMLRNYQKVLLGLVVISASVTNAQDMDIGNPEYENTIRVEYSNSPLLPDGVAFLVTMRMLDFLESDEPHSGTGWIQTEMGLDESDSQEFVNLLLSTFESVETEIEYVTSELGCVSGVPRVYGDDVYTVFEDMDDAREDIAAKHLHILKSEIGEDMAARLQQWLDLRKLSTSQVKFKHKESYELAGKSGDVTLAAICNRLAAS